MGLQETPVFLAALPPLCTASLVQQEGRAARQAPASVLTHFTELSHEITLNLSEIVTFRCEAAVHIASTLELRDVCAVCVAAFCPSTSLLGVDRVCTVPMHAALLIEELSCKAEGV